MPCFLLDSGVKTIEAADGIFCRDSIPWRPRHAHSVRPELGAAVGRPLCLPPQGRAPGVSRNQSGRLGCTLLSHTAATFVKEMFILFYFFVTLAS